jgi:hypothetical protein
MVSIHDDGHKKTFVKKIKIKIKEQEWVVRLLHPTWSYLSRYLDVFILCAFTRVSNSNSVMISVFKVP